MSQTEQASSQNYLERGDEGRGDGLLAKNDLISLPQQIQNPGT